MKDVKDKLKEFGKVEYFDIKKTSKPLNKQVKAINRKMFLLRVKLLIENFTNKFRRTNGKKEL